MKYQLKVIGTRAQHITPPLYRAIDDEGKIIFVTPDMEQAKRALEDLLEEYHESIAFEADHHHHALDARFYQLARVEAF